jgi:outer membrane protein TolC
MAVQTALELNPDAANARAELNRARGAVLEEQGVFDTTLNGRLFTEYRRQELPQTVKDQEIERRTDLSDALAAARRDYDQLQELSRLLGVVRGATPGAPQVDAIAAIAPDVASQLRALDVLIAAQPDAATRGELQRIRNEFVDRTIADASEGAASAIDGYEEGENQLRRLGASPDDEVLYNGGFEVGISRRLRSGITFTPFADGRVDGENYRGKLHGVEDGGKGIEDLYTFRAGVATVIPLGRGRGAAASGAAERAANLERDASTFDVRFELSRVAIDTVSSYWEVRAAMASRDAIAEQVERQQRLVDLTQAAIDAGEQPGVEAARVGASFARAQARLRDADRSLIDARVALATAMGIAADQRDLTLPLASDAFPALAEPNIAIDTLSAGAAADRADRQAAEQRLLAGQALETGARTNLRPVLDLSNQIWYTALAEHSAGDAVDRWVGPSVDVQLQFRRPIGNNTARGQYVQRQAEAQRRQTDAARSAREIGLNVIGVAETVGFARQRVESARAAVTAFEQTGAAEVERFQAGEATLIDVILTENQQTDARLTLIEAERALATSIAQLRFESGTLLQITDQLQPRFGASDLISLPSSRER